MVFRFIEILLYVFVTSFYVAWNVETTNSDWWVVAISFTIGWALGWGTVVLVEKIFSRIR